VRASRASNEDIYISKPESMSGAEGYRKAAATASLQSLQ
jgi:hypothetical protein